MEEHKEIYKRIEKLELKDLEAPSNKTFKQIHCPSCGSQIAAGDVSLQNQLAKCSSCAVIFSIEDEVQAVKSKIEAKQEVSRPVGVELYEYKGNLDIEVRQLLNAVDGIAMILLPTLLFIVGLLVFKSALSMYWLIALVLALCLFIYRMLNRSKDKTYIEVGQNYLKVKSRPRNFKKDIDIRVDEIDQIYIKNYVGTAYYYVFAIVNGVEGQRHEKLLTVASLAQAKYIEQELEGFMRIKDRKVPESEVKV